MNKQDYERISAQPETPRAISPGDLADQTPRTLIYGYTHALEGRSSATWHLYLDDDGDIKLAIYGPSEQYGPGSPVPSLLKSATYADGGFKTDAEYVPPKRSYPEACDAQFCALLKSRGVSLHFTTWDDERARKHNAGPVYGPGGGGGPFYGLQIEDLPDADAKTASRFSLI